MFAPLWGDSLLLAKNVIRHVRKNDIVLDLGTGVGIQGIFAAKSAKKVVCVDINPQAVKCAKLNVKFHKLNEKIKVLKSDLFSNIQGKFDLIIFNPPFRWFKPRSMLERGEVDFGYGHLRKFFNDIKNHLNKKGRALLVFSNSGDIRYFEKLIVENKFKNKILDKKKINGWLYKIYLLRC